MTEVDLLIMAAAALAWVAWVPATRRRGGTAIRAAEPSAVEWLTNLRAQLVVSPDFTAALAGLPPPPSELNARLERLRQVTAETGGSALGPVHLLLGAARQDARRRARWRERSGGAMVSSTLLAVLPVGLWLTSGSVGVSPITWLTTSPAGWLCLLLFGGLTALSRWWLRRSARAALGLAATAARPRPLRRSVAAGASFVAVASLLPDGKGLVLAALTSSVVANVWQGFESERERSQAARAMAERPWLAALLASGLAAGLDWRRAVSVLAREADVDQSELLAVERRLSWGVEPAVAFAAAGEHWQEVAIAISQTMAMGAPVAAGLAALGEHWQRELGDQELERVERIAARAVIPVSLLQLPAFIIGGLLPILAVSVQPLLEAWLSTSP